jgi:hypothetical protein
LVIEIYIYVCILQCRTSAQPQNSKPITEKLFGPLVSRLQFILDRTHCENAPIGIKSNDVVKNLNLIWDSPEWSQNGRWNERNTILIDDSIGKARKNPKNLLLAPEYDVLNTAYDFSKDIFLLKLAEWTELVAKRIEVNGVNEDVSTLIQLQPEGFLEFGAPPRPKPSLGPRIYVRNLTNRTDEKQLFEFFSKFGKVTESLVIKSRETGQSRGFGYITFATDEMAQTAIQSMDSAELDGRKIVFGIADVRSR